MKIVINACHGGFSLSNAAIKYLAEKTNQPLFWFTCKWDDDAKKQVYTPVTLEEANENFFNVRAFKTDKPDELAEHQEDANWFWVINNIKRNDPLLIETVEALGEEAFADYSELKIVEIPDDVDWVIEEYDGWEWVAEKHRKWY